MCGVQEAKADLPRNGYVAGAAAALLLLLQLAGATAALLLASRGPDGSTRGSFTQVNRRRYLDNSCIPLDAHLEKITVNCRRRLFFIQM